MRREFELLVCCGISGLALTLSTSSAVGQVKTTGRFYPTVRETPKPTETPTPSATANPEADTDPPTPVQEETSREPEQARPTVTALEQGGRLDLVCAGAGAANKLNETTTNGTFSGDINSYGDHLGEVDGTVTTTTTSVRRDEFGDIVALFIDGLDGRLRMPRIMLPPIRGGEDGWFKLKNIKIKQNEITASISVNPFNNPKLRLDRYTGTISINGKAGDYAGVCKRITRDELRREF